MKLIYDHQKLCLHKKLVIPHMIKMGQMISEILNGVNPKFLKNVITQLKREYAEHHNDILNTTEKKNHVQNVLDKIANQKYNFAKQNIEQGQKFNIFYQENQIKLPAQQRNFKCDHCKDRHFKTNASLYSHYRSCPGKLGQKNAQQNNEDSVSMNARQGFRPVRRRETIQTQPRTKKLVVVEIKKQNIQVVKDQQKKEREMNYKRQKPVSSQSFGSQIFQDYD